MSAFSEVVRPNRNPTLTATEEWMTLWQKIRLGSLAEAHKIADRAIAANSVEAARQMVRDLETATKGVESDANAATGETRTIKRTIQEKEARVRVLDTAITKILTDDKTENDIAATAKQIELTAITKSLEENRVELAEATKVATELENALKILNMRHTDMLSKLDTLQRNDHAAHAEETAADALRHSREVLESGAGQSVDNLIGKVAARRDVAQVGFEREVRRLNTATDQDEAIAEAKAEIERRRATLVPASAVK